MLICVSVCLSTAACPHYCTHPDVTWQNDSGWPLVVHYWADLQSVHGLCCYDTAEHKCFYLLMCLVINAQTQESITQVINAGYNQLWNLLCSLNNWRPDWLSKVLRLTRYKIGHFGDVPPSQSLGLVLKKLNLTQQKQSTQEQIRTTQKN